MKRFIQLLLAMLIVAMPSSYAQQKDLSKMHLNKNKTAVSTARNRANLRRQSPDVEVTGVSFEQSMIRLIENPTGEADKKYELTAIVTPSNATNVTYTWAATSKNVVIEGSGKTVTIYATKIGRYMVGCYVGDDYKLVAHVEISSEMNMDQCIFFGSTDGNLKPNNKQSFNSTCESKFDYAEKWAETSAGTNYLVHFTGPVNRIPPMAYSKRKNLTAVILPSSTKVVHFDAFRECTEAFRDIHNASLHIPAKVKMAENAFYDCGRLEDVFIHSPVPDDVPTRTASS